MAGDDDEEDIDDIEHEFKVDDDQNKNRNIVETILHGKMTYGRGPEDEDSAQYPPVIAGTRSHPVLILNPYQVLLRQEKILNILSMKAFCGCRLAVNSQYRTMEMESRCWDLRFTKGYIPIQLLNLEVQDGMIRKREGGKKEWKIGNFSKDTRGKIMMTLLTLICPCK